MQFLAENLCSKANNDSIEEYQSALVNDLYRRRFDRAFWSSYNFANASFLNMTDAHFVHPIFGKNWHKFRQLLGRILTKPNYLRWCDHYHQKFMRLLLTDKSALHILMQNNVSFTK